MDVIDKPESGNRPSRTIEDVLQNGYEFHFGEYLSSMFNMLKDTWAYFLGYSGVLIVMIIIIEVLLLTFMIGGLASDLALQSTQPDPMAILNKMMWMYAVIFVVIILLFTPMRAGIHLFLENGSDKKNFNFADFFGVFKNKWLKVAGTSFLIIFLASIWQVIPGVLMFQDMMAMASESIANPGVMPNPFFIFDYIGWLFLGYIPMIYFLTIFSLAIPILLFKTDSIGRALEVSMKIVHKKFFYFFGLYALVLILTYAGVLACGVGLLITMNFFPMVIWCIYRDIFGSKTANPDPLSVG